MRCRLLIARVAIARIIAVSFGSPAREMPFAIAGRRVTRRLRHLPDHDLVIANAFYDCHLRSNNAPTQLERHSSTRLTPDFAPFIG